MHKQYLLSSGQLCLVLFRKMNRFFLQKGWFPVSSLGKECPPGTCHQLNFYFCFDTMLVVEEGILSFGAFDLLKFWYNLSLF